MARKRKTVALGLPGGRAAKGTSEPASSRTADPEPRDPLVFQAVVEIHNKGELDDYCVQVRAQCDHDAVANLEMLGVRSFSAAVYAAVGQLQFASKMAARTFLGLYGDDEPRTPPKG